MPIIPIPEVQGGDYTPRANPVLPASALPGARAARIAAEVGDAAVSTAQFVEKQRRLQETTDAANAYMKGLKDMDQNYTAIAADPSQHLTAPETLEKLNQKALNEATKGLSTRVATHATRQSAPVTPSAWTCAWRHRASSAIRICRRPVGC